MEALRGADLPTPTEDIEQGKRNLDEFGLTIHENFLPSVTIDLLMQRVEEQAALERELGVAAFALDEGNVEIPDNFIRPKIGKPIGLPKIQRVYFLVNKGRIFIELAKHPIALAYAKHIFRGIPFNVGSQFGQIIRKGAPAQIIHTDHDIPFPTPIPLSVFAMVALADIDEDMAATRVVPGSNRWPAPVPLGAADENMDTIRQLQNDWTDENLKGKSSHITTSPVVLKRGSAVFWENRLWHGQGASVSDRPRYSCGTMYGVDFLKPTDDYPAVIHDNIYATLTEEERILYGFDSRSAGLICPRTPDDIRTNVHCQMPYVPELRRQTSR